jgi:hypothetical protein
VETAAPSLWAEFPSDDCGTVEASDVCAVACGAASCALACAPIIAKTMIGQAKNITIPQDERAIRPAYAGRHKKLIRPALSFYKSEERMNRQLHQ